MATREDLQEWVIEALRALGGKAHIVQIFKYIGRNTNRTCDIPVILCTRGNMMSGGQGKSCGTKKY